MGSGMKLAASLARSLEADMQVELRNIERAVATVVPVDPRYLGLWLTGLFGDPDTTDNLDGSWDHEFASGGEDLPSYTLEVGMPKVPAFFRHAGVKLNSVALEFSRSGPAAATISAIAQGETRFGTTQGGTPTSLTFSRISQFHVWTAPALQAL
jgi:Phage tail tube protein